MTSSATVEVYETTNFSFSHSLISKLYISTEKFQVICIYMTMNYLSWYFGHFRLQENIKHDIGDAASTGFSKHSNGPWI